MEKKKDSRAQLEKKIGNSLLFIEKTKDTKTVFFKDKMLTISITNDFALIETSFHRHVFSAITGNGYSRPYLYASAFVDIVKEKNIKDEEGNYKYADLMDSLKNDEDKKNMQICWLFDLYLFNIFMPLYSIGESEFECFSVYEQYLHNIAKSSISLSERNEDITNKQYIEKVCSLLKDFTKDIVESVVLEKLTDEDIKEREMEAIKEQEKTDYINEQIKEETKKEEDGRKRTVKHK